MRSDSLPPLTISEEIMKYIVDQEAATKLVEQILSDVPAEEFVPLSTLFNEFLDALAALDESDHNSAPVTILNVLENELERTHQRLLKPTCLGAREEDEDRLKDLHKILEDLAIHGVGT
jgi:hypothetical protein